MVRKGKMAEARKNLLRLTSTDRETHFDADKTVAVRVLSTRAVSCSYLDSDDGAHNGAGTAPHSGCFVPRLLPGHRPPTDGDHLYVLGNSEPLRKLLHGILGVLLPTSRTSNVFFVLVHTWSIWNQLRWCLWGVVPHVARHWTEGFVSLRALWALCNANNYRMPGLCPGKVCERGGVCDRRPDAGVGDILPTYGRDGVLLACWRDSKSKIVDQDRGVGTECLVSKLLSCRITHLSIILPATS